MGSKLQGRRLQEQQELVNVHKRAPKIRYQICLKIAKLFFLSPPPSSFSLLLLLLLKFSGFSATQFWWLSHLFFRQAMTNYSRARLPFDTNSFREKTVT